MYGLHFDWSWLFILSSGVTFKCHWMIFRLFLLLSLKGTGMIHSSKDCRSLFDTFSANHATYYVQYLAADGTVEASINCATLERWRVSTKNIGKTCTFQFSPKTRIFYVFSSPWVLLFWRQTSEPKTRIFYVFSSPWALLFWRQTSEPPMRHCRYSSWLATYSRLPQHLLRLNNRFSGRKRDFSYSCR